MNDATGSFVRWTSKIGSDARFPHKPNGNKARLNYDSE
jgi:hypothetical protein